MMKANTNNFKATIYNNIYIIRYIFAIKVLNLINNFCLIDTLGVEK